jgi:phosphohistidine phosphatase SixA
LGGQCLRLALAYTRKFTRREYLAAWAGLCALALVPRFLSGEALLPTNPEELVTAMQQGGKVLFLRHAATNSEEIDTGELGNRPGQRNLSAGGIMQAKALGNAFRTANIPFSRIATSPVFRARDTAELAFALRNIEITMELVADDYAGEQLQFMIESTRHLLNASPPDGTNILLIGHRTPLQMATGQNFPDSIFPEGAIAVFEPGGESTLLLGTLTAEDFISVAEKAAN